MTLKEMWTRLSRESNPGIEFEEFEEMMNDWAWQELERQRGSVTGNVYKVESDIPTEGY